jgi:DNA-binding Xre family transcriptional regulator
MTQILWKLKPYLEKHSIAAHKLALEAGISPPNLYTLIRGEGAKNVSRDTLAKLIGALRRLTGQAVTPNDLFEVIETLEPEISTVSTNLEDAAKALHAAESTVSTKELNAWLQETSQAVRPLKGKHARA